MPRFPRFSCLAAILLSLAGCTSMPVSSMYALSKIDVMTSDLSRLRIALATPAALRPRPGGVNMEVTIGQAGKAPEKKVIRLVETTEAADFVGLPASGQGGQSLHAYKMSREGIAELEAVRREAAATRADKKKGSLGIGVAAKEFCLAGALPDGALLASTWMATSETGGYVVIARDYDLRDDRQVAESIATMDRCSGQ